MNVVRTHLHCRATTKVRFRARTGIALAIMALVVMGAPYAAEAVTVTDISIKPRSGLIVGTCNTVKVVVSRTVIEQNAVRLPLAIGFNVRLRLESPNGGRTEVTLPGTLGPYQSTTIVQFGRVGAAASGTYNVTAFLGTQAARSESFLAGGTCLPDLAVTEARLTRGVSGCALYVDVDNLGIDSPGPYDTTVEAIFPSPAGFILRNGPRDGVLFELAQYPRGIYNLRITADAGNTVREIDETGNNVLLVTVDTEFGCRPPQ